MNLTIKLSPATQIAIETEASARNMTLEQAASYILDTFFTLHGVREEGYDAWFRATVEESLKSLENGDFVSNDEMMSRAKKRREWLLAQTKAME